MVTSKTHSLKANVFISLFASRHIFLSKNISTKICLIPRKIFHQPWHKNSFATQKCLSQGLAQKRFFTSICEWKSLVLLTTLKNASIALYTCIENHSQHLCSAEAAVSWPETEIGKWHIKKCAVGMTISKTTNTSTQQNYCLLSLPLKISFLSIGIIEL